MGRTTIELTADEQFDGPSQQAATRPTGQPELCEKELCILNVLLSRQGKVVPRVELARAVGLRSNERRVDVLLVAVRRVLGDDGLINVRGRGWMIPSEVDVASLLSTSATD
jgi:DNA-binding response OmpR family regulator